MKTRCVFFPFIFVMIFVLAACHPQENNRDAETGTTALLEELQGHWLNVDLLDELQNTHSPHKVSRFPPFTEIVIGGSFKDSILMTGLNNTAVYPFSTRADTIFIKGIYADSSHVLLLKDSEGREFLTLLDNDDKQWLFIKAHEKHLPRESNGTAFPQAVNDHLIAGKYVNLHGNTGGVHDTVHFLANGTVKGFGAWVRYEICFGGICMNWSEEDCISFYKNGDTRPEAFGFRWETDEEGGKTLILLDLNKTPGEEEVPHFEKAGVRMRLEKLTSID